MKRLTYILLGSILGGTSTYVLTRLIGYLIEPHYTPSGEEEMTRNFMIFIISFLVITVLGGVIANLLYNKSLTKK